MVDFAPVITPTRIIPASDEDGFRQMLLLDPFEDPPNSFRANTITDMYEITPEPSTVSSFIFDVGIDPKIDPIIFAVRNKTTNVVLSVTLTLPSYLQSDIGTTFEIPFITLVTGLDDPTPPPPVIDVTVSFNEEIAKTFNPDTRLDTIVFDIFPVGELVEPVFVIPT